MKRILLLTDFSNAAENAIEFALRFWSGVHCEFFLAHIQDSSHFTSDNLIAHPSSASIYDSLVKQSKNKLRLLKKDLVGQYSEENYSFKSVVDVDGFTEAINQLVQLHGIDQVVLGSNGASNIKEVFFGSHALMAMRSVDCNVLVIPYHYKFQRSDVLLFILEENDQFTPSILDQLLFLADLVTWKIQIIRFMGEIKNEKMIESDQDLLKSVSNNFNLKYNIVQDVSISNTIEVLIQIKEIGLVAMLGNFKSLLSRLSSRANKSEVGKLGKVPIMSLKT